MLLAFDIGNTNIVLGCFKGEELLFEFRLKTDPDRTIDEYAGLLFALFNRKIGKDFVFEKSIISSVVPDVTKDIVKLVEDSFNITPLVVGPGIKTGIDIKLADPSSVGSDRIVNAVAVKKLYGTPALVVDFGTATSFDYVSEKGVYEGGIIAPGLKVSLDSLVRQTAKLPRIELTYPKNVVGTNTATAMQSGALIGYVCLVEGLIDKIEEEKGVLSHIIATGGLGSLIAGHCKQEIHYEPHLTLRGLRIIADL